MKKTTLYNTLGIFLISVLTVLPFLNANAGTEVPSSIKNKGKINLIKPNLQKDKIACSGHQTQTHQEPSNH